VASLFRDETSSLLHGVSAPLTWGSRRFEWVTRHADGTTEVTGLPYAGASEFPSSALLYGSMTRDRAGRFYVVGTMARKPLVLQVTVKR
jgi:hypothetical protein